MKPPLQTEIARGINAMMIVCLSCHEIACDEDLALYILVWLCVRLLGRRFRGQPSTREGLSLVTLRISSSDGFLLLDVAVWSIRG